jgi:aspartyl-tRNA(Asn)/glutamyl-tRNA(Gln) amidotransferase subunit A
VSSSSNVQEISKKLSSGNYGCVDIAKEALSKIEELNKKLNAFVEVDEECVLRDASRLQKELLGGQNVGMLHGVPVAIKSNIDTTGYNINACSGPLHGRYAKTDADCIKNLRKAGALIIGTTNMHELAFGGTGHISVYGPAKNPNDITRIPGGSSSGSAVAVASKMVPLSLGTDTGGSVRIPASACGVVGYKPSINEIDTNGVLPLSWTLDHVGTLASNVSDAALGAACLMGNNSRVGNEIISSLIRCGKETDARERKYRIGLVETDGMSLSPEVSTVLAQFIGKISNGKVVIEKEVLKYSVESHIAWLNIMYSEASSYYTDNNSFDYTAFSSEIRVQLEAGRYISALDYLKAQRFRKEFSRYFYSFFDKYDFLIMPTLPIVAPRFVDKFVALGERELTIQDAMTFTNSIANMVGCPAITVPIGSDANGMPIGLSILASYQNDSSLIEFAKIAESMVPDTAT